MQISALLNLVNPQEGVPLVGTAPMGFEQMIAQMLSAGGPEPPGGPPGEANPFGEKLTTQEPNAQSIQPDSAAQLETIAATLGVLAISREPAAIGLPSPAELPTSEVSLVERVDADASATPFEVVGLPAPEPTPASEQVAFNELLSQPDLGITRIVVEQTTRPVQPDVANPALREALAAGVPNKFDPMKPRPIAEPSPTIQPIETEAAKVAPTKPAEVVELAPNEVRVDAPPKAAEPDFEFAADISESNLDTTTGDPSSDQHPDQDTKHNGQPLPLTVQPSARTAEAKSFSAERTVTVHPLVRDLADRIEMMAASRPQETVTVEFRPLDLGDIKVMLTQSNDRVEATVITDNDRVRQAVHGMQADLRTALDQRGVQLGSFSVMDFGQPREQATSNPHRQPTPMNTSTREAPDKRVPVQTATSSGVDLSI